MEIIPFIQLKKRKILDEKEESAIDNILECFKDNKIYVLDIDGIEKDKPNLCLYQKISNSYELWIDSGPVVIGDVVDYFIAGATTITIRKNLWNKLDLPRIREITENEIYIEINLRDMNENTRERTVFDDADGLVIFNNRSQIESDFKYGDVLRELCARHKTYVYESNPRNVFYWEQKGVKGLLVDIGKVEEFKKNGI